MTRMQVKATPGPNYLVLSPMTIVLNVEDEEFAHGTFGHIFKAELEPTMETVAIKKVLQEKQMRNRELSVMRHLSHPNVVELKFFFMEETEKEELYLYLVLEFLPDSLYRVIRRLTQQRRYMPLIYIRLVMFQLLRALAYIHSYEICHRDIKPHNILMNSSTAVVKLCDFGSAKKIVPEDSNIAYICSRFYRSPECIFGQTAYDTSIDIWATGCVFGELLSGGVMFVGSGRIDQIAQIIKVLGSPTTQDLNNMNPEYGELELPVVPKKPWEQYFDSHVPQEAIDLIDSMLRYSPKERLKAFEGMTKEFFSPLRDSDRRLSDGNPLPPLFNWTSEELTSMTPSVRSLLVDRKGFDSADSADATDALKN